MKVAVIVEIGGRTVMEQLTTAEDFRGDYRAAVGECASRIELATYGPGRVAGDTGHSFDEQIRPT